MTILFSNEIINAVEEELKCATSSVQIITAYCKEKTFKRLDSLVSDSVTEKRLLVRFRLDDIIKGSTDFGIVEYGITNGWKVYIRFDLHAKTYIVDNKRGLVGSANATDSGLNIGKSGNMEIATFVDIDPEDVEKIGRLFTDAILVDEKLLADMKEQIEKIPADGKKERYSWNINISKLFNPHVDTLFSYELPDAFVFEKGEYFSFLDTFYNGNLEEFKELFRWSNSYLWLLNLLKENNGCMYFGETSARLHSALITDPKPYRKDVKSMLANLLSLIEKLEMEEIVIDRPNYSQRIRLNDLHKE